MSPGDVAPMVLGITFTVVVGGVILLRPIFKRLGNYLEVLAEERRRDLSRQPLNQVDAQRVTAMLEAIDQRLAHLEERQEFTDKLLVQRPAKALEP